MTPKQQERLRAKIDKIKKALAADKRRNGGYYDDSAGWRFMPPELYLKLEDYAGAMRYFNWFSKNFPDSAGYPPFLFEWTIALFKTNKKKEAVNMAYRVFLANTYFFDKFFGKEIVPVEKWEGANWEKPEFVEYLSYDYMQPNLADFAKWLEQVLQNPDMSAAMQQYVELQRRFKTTSLNTAERAELLGQIRQIEERRF